MPENLLFHLGGFIEPELLWGQQTESGQQETDVGQFPRDRRVQGIAFALAYIRRDCLDRIGMLDELFHSYFEDTDYCLRAADAGIASVVAGAVTVCHDQHGSTRDDGGFRERLWTESRASFAARWQQTADRKLSRHRALAGPDPPAARLRPADPRPALAPRCALAAHGLFGGRAGTARWQRLPSRTGRAPHAAVACPKSPWSARPDQLQTMARGRFRVSLAFSEWARPGAAWVEHCNRFDLLLVPDEFQADAYREAGVTRPDRSAAARHRSRVLPSRTCRRNGIRADNSCSSASPRCSDATPRAVIAAFRRSFDANDPVELVIYICPGNDESALRQSLEPLAAADNGARVRIMAGWGFPAYERAQLLVAADAYVSARRGAGWDPVVREAIACGRVVVAPAYGSQKALIEQWGHAVEVREEVGRSRPAGPPVGAAGFRESLEWRMRDVFNRRAELVCRSGHAGRQPFAEAHNLDISADRLAELLARGGTLKPAAAKPPRPPPGRPAAACGRPDRRSRHAPLRDLERGRPAQADGGLARRRRTAAARARQSARPFRAR